MRFLVLLFLLFSFNIQSQEKRFEFETVDMRTPEVGILETFPEKLFFMKIKNHIQFQL
jgi:hypothetical protein